MTFPDGSVKEGRFENNVYVGPQGGASEGFNLEGEVLAKKIIGNAKFL